MHPTMTRLYEAVERLTGIKGQSAVARELNESPQTLRNWETRGVSSQGQIKAQELFGINPNWLKSGEGYPDQATMLLQENLARQGIEDAHLYLAGLGRMPAGGLPIYPNQKRLGYPGLKNTEEAPDIRGLVPLISWVAAGAFDVANDPLQPGDAEDWLPMPKRNGKHTYALRVRGDSMTAPHGKSYPDGCIIFVDPEKRSPSTGDRIIAKLEGTDEVTFKQFVSDAGRIWLKALNPTYPPIVEPFKVLGTIIGKWEDE